MACACGLTAGGEAFCPRRFDSQYTHLLQRISEELPQLHACHTLARHDIYECLILNIGDKEQLDLLDAWIVAKFERDSPAEITGNEPCIKQHSRVSQYWSAKAQRTISPDLHRLLTIKAAQIMQQPSFVVLICFLVGIVVVSFRN